MALRLTSFKIQTINIFIIDLATFDTIIYNYVLSFTDFVIDVTYL
jgi:hypothetical protein